MAMIDLKRELKHLYSPSAKAVVEADVPALRFLMIDGQGDPNTTPAYAEAVVKYEKDATVPALTPTMANQMPTGQRPPWSLRMPRTSRSFPPPPCDETAVQDR